MGGLVYDMAGRYAPSFAIGVAANIANIAVIGFLVRKDRRPSIRVLATA